MSSPNALTWCYAHLACDEAIAWLRRCKIKTMNEAWAKCRRSDWMLWALYKCNLDREAWKALAIFENRVCERPPPGPLVYTSRDAAPRYMTAERRWEAKQLRVLLQPTGSQP